MTISQESRDRLNLEQIGRNISLSQRLREEGLSRIAFAAMNKAHVARGAAKEICKQAQREAVKALTDTQRERAEGWKKQIAAITQEAK
jgi:hypothetical protein